MLLLFILAPPRQLEGTDRPGGCGTPKLAWESREGNVGVAGLGHVMLQMAPMPSFKAFGFKSAHVTSRNCPEVPLENGGSDIHRGRRF